jgi:TolB-like protein
MAWAEPAPPSQAAPAAQAATKVLVIPFESLDADQTPDWVGKAIVQSIVTELSAAPGIAPAAGEKSATPLQAAREAGAKFVIIGNCQTMDFQLRVLGQILETDKGQVVGALHMTGPVGNLFEIEDVVARQVRRQLPAVETAHSQTTAESAATPASEAVDDVPLRAAPYYASAIPPLPASAAQAGAWALINGPPDSDAFGNGGAGYCGGGYGYGGYGNNAYGGGRCGHRRGNGGHHGGSRGSGRSSGTARGGSSH